MQQFISYVQEFGYLGFFVIVFFESFPMTFFLPGDSLLFTTGFLASQGVFDVRLLIITFFVAGFFGYIFSYQFGQRIIRKFFTNPNSKIFKPKYITYTHDFFERYGAKTIIIGRFVPIVRSFGPALAGMAGLSFRKFVSYSVVGVFFWSISMTLIGYYLGRILPQADKYLTPIIIVIIVLSVLPSVYDYWKNRNSTVSNEQKIHLVDCFIITYYLCQLVCF